MTEQQDTSRLPALDSFDPDVRCAALRLLANARSGEYLPDVADDTITHKRPQLSEILQFLASFGYEAVRQIHGQDGNLAARFIGAELEISEAAQIIEHLDVDRLVSEWWTGGV